jgi:hypothetical protein
MLRCTPATELRIGGRGVAHHDQLHVGRQLAGELGHRAAHAVGDRDGVLVGGLDDVQRDGPLAVDEGRVVLLLFAIDHPRDLRQVDRLAAAACDHDALEIGRGLQARADLHDLLAIAADQRAGGQLLVVAPQRRQHLVHTDLQRLHLGRLQVDLDLALDPAHQRDAAHAADVFEAALDDLVGEGGELAGAALG